MFLHSGTGLHAHEYSRPRSNSLPRRIPLKRSAFSTPLPPKPTIYKDPSPSPRRPLRPLSDNTTPVKETVVRFLEAEKDIMNEDARSVANSEGSVTTAGCSRRRKRSLRTSTTFHLAHPAPTLTQKQRLLQIRPKLLLQLQDLSAGARPKPSLDVLPSTVVVPRLYKKFPRMFRGKGELGCNDVMIVKSEEYETRVINNIDGSDSDEDGLSSRDLVAVVCQMPKDSGGAQGKAEMVLGDGSIWVASPLPNGLYEFQSTNDQGIITTARWVRRSNRRRSVDVTEAVVNNNEKKFTFSMIDPSSRRHPILATINQNNLDIPDSYMPISSSAGRQPPLSPMQACTGEDLDETAEEGAVPERASVALPERLKTLIQVTGIWVALRQGWSPYFKYDDAMTVPNIQTSSGGRVRSMSLTPDTGRLSPALTCASTPESCASARGSALGVKIRRVSGIGHPGNGTSPQLEQGFPPPKRAISTGTAFMQRAAARRAGAPSTVASDSEGESMTEVKQRLTRNDAGTEDVTPSTSLKIPEPSMTTPDTPTRPQRRPQSYIAPSSLRNSFTTNSQPARHSVAFLGENQPVDAVAKPKVSRWKVLTNLFRRARRGARSDRNL